MVHRRDAQAWAKGTEYLIKECGYLVHEDERGITLAGRYKPEDINTEAQFGSLQFVPKPWIVKRKTIEV